MVIAVEPGVPQADEIIAATIAHLTAAGVKLSNILVLLAPEETELVPALAANAGARVGVGSRGAGA